jgi:hypothetical protein
MSASEEYLEQVERIKREQHITFKQACRVADATNRFDRMKAERAARLEAERDA